MINSKKYTYFISFEKDGGVKVSFYPRNLNSMK